MKPYYIIVITFFVVALAGCRPYKTLITDEIILKDGNTHTGTILQTDSVNIKIKKADESKLIIPWITIDSVVGKKFKTVWFGANTGYYKAPYFSVFRNESLAAENLGMQFKVGLASRGVRLCYISLLLLPDEPYNMNKFGLGIQRYTGRSTYLKKNSFFIGTEVNFMNVKQNNGSQITLEPFTGYEKKINERCRIHFKLGLQFNLFNKNNQAGVNTTIGFHFMKRDFKKYYDTLNREHRISKK